MTDETVTPDQRVPAAVHADDVTSYARAETSDGRTVVMGQGGGGSLRWWVPDARYSDGWRELTDRDEIGALVADINAHQVTQAEAVTSGPGDGPVLVKGDDGASLIGTGLAPVMVGETGPETVDLPAGTEITRPDEATPTDSEPDA